MIVLDTNVVSGLMRREPDYRLVSWVDRQAAESLWLTSITVFEIRFGIELLAFDRQRRELAGAFERMIREDFEQRILAFDEEAANRAALFAAKRRAAGTSLDFRDLQIAGIVSARKAALATRNLRHFEGLGVEILDPSQTESRSR